MRRSRRATRGGSSPRRPLVMPDNLTTAQRIALIKKALKDCGQRVTEAAVREQFKRETGKFPGAYDQGPAESPDPPSGRSS